MLTIPENEQDMLQKFLITVKIIVDILTVLRLRHEWTTD